LISGYSDGLFHGYEKRVDGVAELGGYTRGEPYDEEAFEAAVHVNRFVLGSFDT
jgi:hypothetical protein